SYHPIHSGSRAAGRIFVSFLRPGQGSRRNYLEPAARHAAGLRLYVYGVGRAVRELYLPFHHPADTSVERSLRALLVVDYGARPQPVERLGHVPAARNRKEKWNSTGGLHEPPARDRHALTRSHPRSQPGSFAADSDDNTLDYRRIDSGRHRHRSRFRTTSVHRSHHHRRPDLVPAAHVAGSSGCLFLLCGTADGFLETVEKHSRVESPSRRVVEQRRYSLAANVIAESIADCC